MSGFLGIAAFVGFLVVLSFGSSWVHREYYKRYEEGRAPWWLYHMENTRYMLARDMFYGRPEPPKPTKADS